MSAASDTTATVMQVELNDGTREGVARTLLEYFNPAGLNDEAYVEDMRHAADAVLSYLGEPISESKRTTDDIGPDRYWVCTDWLTQGGRKIIGPFDTQSLALEVRSFVERAEGHNRYFVDAEGR